MTSAAKALLGLREKHVEGCIILPYIQLL